MPVGSMAGVKILTAPTRNAIFTSSRGACQHTRGKVSEFWNKRSVIPKSSDSVQCLLNRLTSNSVGPPLFLRDFLCQCKLSQFSRNKSFRPQTKSRNRVGELLCGSSTNVVNSLPKSKPVGWQHARPFHTSPRRPISPILLMLVKPFAKLAAALTGRSVRKWFRGLGPEEREKVWAAIRRRWYIPAGGSVMLTGSGVVYYYTHIEETPITGRKRFIAFTHEQILKISDEEKITLQAAYGSRLFTENDIETLRVIDVMGRLLEANPEMRSGVPFDKWEIYVVNDPVCNACVLPNGCVFVFNGMLKIASSQDELAIVLGHEVAHAVLSHGVEELSLGAFVDYFVILCLAAIWCILPSDGIALVTHWFYNKVIQLLTHMPHSRKIEKEADKVGLMFAAKACYDVRAGSVLWQKMALNEKLTTEATEQLPEWMSTHPDSSKRAEHLDFLLPLAETWRDSMKCPRLPKHDPRQTVIAVSQEVDNILAAKKAGQNLKQVEKAS
ncbi:metalloendopeptidase OMA1, mitochondrial [Aplysia californica]|uniref:Metalloendopeptidase OMA1, mitochondrial n=1 Tax=Aplysia californica TaxID=6500 RepID=A0ABM0JQ97_APLCA|nr:metalloendopeptidase OMA1, mitochondrial [Aplysia californica]